MDKVTDQALLSKLRLEELIIRERYVEPVHSKICERATELLLCPALNEFAQKSEMMLQNELKVVQSMIEYLRNKHCGNLEEPPVSIPDETETDTVIVDEQPVEPSENAIELITESVPVVSNNDDETKNTEPIDTFETAVEGIEGDVESNLRRDALDLSLKIEQLQNEIQVFFCLQNYKLHHIFTIRWLRMLKITTSLQRWTSKCKI